MSEPMQLVRPPPSSDEIVFGPGEPMESARHLRQMCVLVDSLQLGWADRTDYYVAGDMFLYFSETQTKKNDFRGPDVLVALDTTRRERKAWLVWEEGGKTPDVIVELLSESTEHVDRGEKMRIYSRTLGVGEYFLFDPFSGVFEGYELDGARGSYVPKTKEADGRYFSARTGLYLGKIHGTLGGIEADWLRWIDREGHVFPVAEELSVLSAQNLATAQRAQAEAQRARAEALRAQAEALRAQAEADRARADAEVARATAARLEAEIAALKSRAG